MNKLELISALKAEANISKSEAATVVQLFFRQHGGCHGQRRAG